ncbi:MAG: tetratricopeptide repeat protein [Bacteroidales bacterium]|nr:tetratricopeptide repeat protein [Bacteroidales bacterium]
MKSFFLSVILFFLVNSSYSQYDFNKNCKGAYIATINLKFKQAEKAIKIEKNSNPSNLIPYLIENYIDFLTVVIGEQESDFEKLKENKSSRIRFLEKGDKSSPYYRFCLAEIYLQSAFAKLNYGENFTAFFEIKRSFNLIEKNIEQFPDFHPNYLCSGLLHALIGSIPDNYKWVSTIFLLDGNVNQGANELKFVLDSALISDNYSHLKIEALYYLSFIQLNLQANSEHLSELLDYFDTISHDSNMTEPLLCYSLASIYMKNGENDKAMAILQKSNRSNEYYPYDYLDYLLGETKLYKFDDEAIIHFEKYVNNFKGKNYLKSAYRKIAWSYLIKGNKNKYLENILKVKSCGRTFVGADKQAQKEAESNIIPNIVLLKTRLLFDGGYYQKALDQLNEPDTNYLQNTKDSLECEYRKARIYHKLAKTDEAILYYDNVLKKGSEYPYYFAANSALQLGFIYENMLEFKKAESYYKKCLSLDFDEYRKSIRQKAKAGINRIEDRE